jgi:hypothetical protein
LQANADSLHIGTAYPSAIIRVRLPLLIADNIQQEKELLQPHRHLFLFIDSRSISRLILSKEDEQEQNAYPYADTSVSNIEYRKVKFDLWNAERNKIDNIPSIAYPIDNVAKRTSNNQSQNHFVVPGTNI